MTMKERTVWAQLFVFPLAAIVFLALTLPQLSDGPADRNKLPIIYIIHSL